MLSNNQGARTMVILCWVSGWCFYSRGFMCQKAMVNDTLWYNHTPSSFTTLPRPPRLSCYCSYLEGVWFYHRVSQGVPFYHSSMVKKLLTVGPYHRSRTLPE